MLVVRNRWRFPLWLFIQCQVLFLLPLIMSIWQISPAPLNPHPNPRFYITAAVSYTVQGIFPSPDLLEFRTFPNPFNNKHHSVLSHPNNIDEKCQKWDICYFFLSIFYFIVILIQGRFNKNIFLFVIFFSNIYLLCCLLLCSLPKRSCLPSLRFLMRQKVVKTTCSLLKSDARNVFRVAIQELLFVVIHCRSKLSFRIELHF